VKLEKFNGVTMPMFEGVGGARLFLVQDEEAFKAFFDALMEQSVVSCDTETSGLEWYKEHIVGASFGWKTDNFYIPIRHKPSVLEPEKVTQLDPEFFFENIRHFFNQKDVMSVWHNWKFDAHMYFRDGVEIKTPFHDTLILWKLYDENAPGQLKSIASGWRDALGRFQKGLVDSKAGNSEKELKLWRGKEARARRKVFSSLVDEKCDFLETNVEFQKYNRRELKQYIKSEILHNHDFAKTTIDDVHYGYVPVEMMCEYAGLDTFFTTKIYEFCMKNISWTESVKKLYLNEVQLSRAIFDIEEKGICLDVPYLDKVETILKKDIEALEIELKRELNDINLRSSEQLGQALLKVGVPLTKRTNTGNLMVSKDVLADFRTEYDIIDSILSYKELEKLRSTYVEGIKEKLVGNILHCNFNQNVTTGRMSSSDPNLQNIPGKSNLIRAAFVPPNDEYVYVLCDYSQVELRLTAHFSQDPLLLDSYAKGQDVHSRTMCEMFGEFYEEVAKIRQDELHPRHKDLDLLRSIAKTINFAIIYGVGPSGLAKQIPRPEQHQHLTPAEWVQVCKEYQDNYLSTYLGVKRMINKGSRYVKKHGKMTNSFGRVRHLPHYKASKILGSQAFWMEAKAQRQGVNFLVQGTAADIFKIAVVRCAELLKGTKSYMVNMVHDEIQFYIHKSELHLLKSIKERMEDFPQFQVPLLVDMSWTEENWANKKAVLL